MKINFQAAVIYNNVLYFSPIDLNGLFSFDLKTGEVNFLCNFIVPGARLLHTRAFLFKNEAWFLPQKSDAIICVNLDNLKQEKYIVENINNNDNYDAVYKSGIIDGNVLYAIPDGTDYISIIDMEKHTIEAYRNNSITDSKISVVGKRKKTLILFDSTNNRRMLFDTVKKEIEYVTVEDKTTQARCFVDDEIEFEFSSNGYSINKREYDFKCDLSDYAGINKYGDYIYILPFKGKRLLLINRYTGELRWIEFGGEIIRENEADLFMPIMGGENLCLTSVFCGALITIKNEAITYAQIKVDKRWIEKIDVKQNGAVLGHKIKKIENHEYALKDYIGCLC